MIHCSFLHVSEKTNKCIPVVQNSNYAVEDDILVCMSFCPNEPKYNFGRFVFHTIYIIFSGNLICKLVTNIT